MRPRVLLKRSAVLGGGEPPVRRGDSPAARVLWYAAATAALTLGNAGCASASAAPVAAPDRVAPAVSRSAVGTDARTAIRLDSELSSAFVVTGVRLTLDGAVQLDKTNRSGTAEDAMEVPTLRGSVPPGDHVLQVLVKLAGNGEGALSYLHGYRFELRSSRTFTVVEGGAVDLRVVIYEKGGSKTPLEEQPAIRYAEDISEPPNDCAEQKTDDTPEAVAQLVLELRGLMLVYEDTVGTVLGVTAWAAPRTALRARLAEAGDLAALSSALVTLEAGLAEHMPESWAARRDAWARQLQHPERSSSFGTALVELVVRTAELRGLSNARRQQVRRLSTLLSVLFDRCMRSR
jgi:hypothetical protein